MAEKGENLHDVILRLAEELGPTTSFDASLVAREMWPAKPDEVKGEERWRKLIRPVRSAAIGLARQGEIELLRRGDVIDPHKPFKGLYKMRLLERAELEIEDTAFDSQQDQV